MMPIRTITAIWPLAIAVYHGPASLDDYLAHLAQWNLWFARGQRFMVLRVFMDDAALEQADGVARATKQWLVDGAGGTVRSQVDAMVNIVPPSAYARMAALSVEKVFGIPGLIAAGLPDGLDWLRSRFPEFEIWEHVETVVQDCTGTTLSKGTIM
ncbi:hypothetical protein [Niveispirillum cyanobacteriorum]|uniref:Uncharacterized protein n=1 Tax=Niveispirillum cyanobacteriorum TaxID=1612173 RepID=A0A2K9NHY3_9PROT|nr:hypothetical protein [Niveispirillum cyanobacteriorum]AUN32671.1 hypothetical protein C0V82_20345 [Niveispirillum cyanobacteriorum]GGE83152.1 hypothetical protein GCM10011317_45480 [Niveispirillum cyanobacteriorum]